MLDDLTGNPREIRWIPGENIGVFPKESDKFRLLPRGEMASDGYGMSRMISQGHLLGMTWFLREPLLPGNGHTCGRIPK